MDNSDSGSDNGLSEQTYHSYSDDFSSEPHGLLSLVARGSAYIMGESDDDETFEPSEMEWQGGEDTRDFYYRRHRSDSADGTQFEELVSKQKQDSEKMVGNGKFGIPEELVYIDGLQLSEKRFLSHRLHLAQSRGVNFLPPTAITSAFVPNSRGQVSKRYPSRVYSGQFSQDGCTQDFKLRIFDVTDTELIQKKEVQAFVDGTLSNDNKWLAYSSITPMAFLTKSDPSDTYQFPLIFSEEDRFGIWSLRFSSTGKELVAGTSDDSIMILDIETGRVVFRQKGHHDDVNAVCFADPSSNIIFSGSDDGLIKVWDRRSLHGEDCAAAGALVGHTSGITYVSAKGDGRYCLSNGKDQTMKLWDIRWMDYPYMHPKVHPNDISVMTYRGHKVTSTLIRCHFSPASSTGQKYLYSGSSDGRVHIYSLNGDIVQVLDSHLAVQSSDEGRTCADAMNSKEGALLAEAQASSHNSRNFTSLLHSIRFQGTSRPSYIVVRDVSWHPYYPYLITSCWVGDMGRLVKHSYTTPESISV